MTPSVGRFVHYVSRGSSDHEYEPRHVPFLIVDLPFTDVVSGWTFNPNGLRYEEEVVHLEPHNTDDDYHLRGTWHWPERVD